jgi:CRP-like cAMP-binding protein
MSTAGVLKGHTLFQSLSVDEVEAISRFSSVKTLKKGEAVFREDAPATHVFVLLEGSVQLRLATEKGEYGLVVSKIEEGELFGISPLTGSTRYTASALCAKDAEVLAVEAKPLRELLQQDCMIGFQIMSRVAEAFFSRYVRVVKSLQSVVEQIPLIH